MVGPRQHRPPAHGLDRGGGSGLGAGVVLLVCAGFGLRSYYFLHDKEAWDQVASFIDRHQQRGDAIVFSEGFLRIPFDLYYAAPSAYSVKEVDDLTGDPDVFIALDEAKTSGRVWLSTVSHPKTSTDAVVSSLGDAGELVSLTRFTDVDLYLFVIGDGA